MPILEVTETRKRFREMEAMRQRSLVVDIETPLVRDETNSRVQVVFAHEKETVIVTKRLWGPKSRDIYRKETVTDRHNCRREAGADLSGVKRP